MEKSCDKLNENFLQGIIDEKARLLEKIERLDIMADTKFQEKELYEYFVSTFENWEKEIEKIPRHGQGVPNARKVRELFCNIKVAMGTNGEFSRNFDDMLETNVPGFQKCSEKIEKFKAVLDEKTPSPVTVENIRELTGEIIGSFKVILGTLYYEK